MPAMPATGTVPGVIAAAATQTGADFRYLLAEARLESGLDPSARSSASSATGLFQFTDSAWLTTLGRHGAAHGLGWAAAAISNGRVTDPRLRSDILALRSDPQLSALLAGDLAQDNTATLTSMLGRAPDAAELYAAHFFGPDGATRFLTTLGSDPGADAAALLPSAAAANRGTFYTAEGASRSVGAVMALLRQRVAAAMNGSGAGAGAANPWAWPDTTGASAVEPASLPPAPDPGGPLAQAFHAAAREAGAGDAALDSGGALAAPRSMAETLRQTFALADGGTGPGAGAGADQVRAAYGQLSAMGL